MRPASLLERLQAHGARLNDAESGVPEVLHFGDPAGEAAAAAETGGVRDQSPHGRIRVSGADHLDFLNGQCTNDLKAIDASTAVVAALTTVKGRVIDLARVIPDGDGLMLLTSSGQAGAVREALAAKIVMEDCELTDVGERWSSLLVCGSRSGAAAEAVFGARPADRDDHHGATRGSFGDAEVLLADAHAPLGGVEILVPETQAGAAFDALVEAGLHPLGEQAYDQLRIEEGVPALGREMGEHTNPLEAGLNFAVSFTKGCYVGQEVIARLHSRGKVKRQMVGLRFPPEVEPADLDEVFWDLLRVGNVCSAVRSPRKNATLALALVKSDYCKPGTLVYSVKDSEKMEGEVAELPF